MIFRTCSVCGHPMDPGEGQGGICEDCLEYREQLENRRKAVERMVRATEYEQMEMEEFLNG